MGLMEKIVVTHAIGWIYCNMLADWLIL